MGEKAVACVLLTGMLCGLIAGTAGAQTHERGATLNWVRLAGAETCAGPVEMASRIETRLGRRLFVRTPDAVVVVEGQVSTNAAGGLGSVIRVSDPDGQVFGERRLSIPPGHACGELDALSELVIAITLRGQGGGIPLPPDVAQALDALFGEEPSELDPATLPDTTQPAAAAKPAQPATDAPPAHQAREALTLGVGIGLAGASGLQPNGTFGPQMSLRLSIPKLMTLVATLIYGLPQTEPVMGQSQGRVEYQAWLGGLSACLPDTRALASELSLCAQAGMGLLTAQGEGFEQTSRRARRPFAQLGLEGRARTQIAGPLGLALTARVPVRLWRPTVAVVTGPSGDGERFQVVPLGVEGELGLELAF